MQLLEHLDDLYAETVTLELGTPARSIGKLAVRLYSEKQPQVCAFFRALSKSNPGRRIPGRLAGALVCPNYLGCYCQFGALQDKQRPPEAAEDDMPREPGQLLYIKGTHEFMVAYNAAELQNAVVVGEVKGEAFQQLKSLATVDGRSAEVISVTASY